MTALVLSGPDPDNRRFRYAIADMDWHKTVLDYAIRPCARLILKRREAELSALTAEHIRWVYGCGAASYDKVMETIYGGMVDRGRIMETLAPETGEQILEVGIGTGKNLPFYPPGVDLQGTDLTPEMLEKATQKRDRFRGAKLTLSVHDTENLPFEDNTFHRVLATLILCVTPDPTRALREVWRVCRPGGRVVLYELAISPDPNTADMQRIMIRDHVMSIGCPLPAPEYPDGIIVWDPCRDFVTMAEELGFEQESIEWIEIKNPVLARCLLQLHKPESFTTK